MYPVLPIAPDREIVEADMWLTDVQESWSGEEKRIKLLSLPTKQYRYRYSISDVDRAMVESALFGSVYVDDDGNPTRLRWTVPIWADYGELANNLNAGSSTIAVNTIGTRYVAGGLAVIIKRRTGRAGERERAIRISESEIVSIATVNPGSIELLSPTLNAWTAGDILLPAQVGVIIDYVTYDELDGIPRAYAGSALLECGLI